MAKTRIPAPPGPPGRRLVGNSYDYDRDRIGFLTANRERYGDVFSFSANTVFVSDPGLIHDVLNRTNEDFVAEATVFAAAADDKARLERDADGWMRSRKIGFRGLTLAVTRAHGARIAAAFELAIESTGGRECDVVALLRDFTGRMVADFLFGPRSEDVVAATDEYFALVLNYLASNLTIPQWLPLPRVRRTVRAGRRVRAAISAHVDDRCAHPHAEPQDMLDLLLADPGNGLNRHDIVTLLASGMFASFGSPGAAMSWLILEMSRDADVHAKLRTEARRALAEHGTLEDDAPLQYTKAFVREVLRLHPPTWLMGRQVRRDTTLGEWKLRAGQEIMFSPYLLQRDPRWWAEPDTLRPERWLEPATAESRRAYIPFGSGPRVCIGLHLSLYQLATSVARLAAFYRIDAVATEAEGGLGAMLVPRGLRARIIRIEEPAPGAADHRAQAGVHVSPSR
jgi:cytochrome P450